MSEFGVRTPETLLEVVRASENAKEESWREQFLAENLFHDEHLDQELSERPEDRIRLLNLEHEFLQEKRGKNMGERFALALSDKYLGKIHVVELGVTTNPGANGEIDGLKNDYRDLLRWMQQNGIVDDEIARSDSSRSLTMREPAMVAAGNFLKIFVRNRLLIDTTLQVENRAVDIKIAKRMVFSLPIQTTQALVARFSEEMRKRKNVEDESVLEFVEDTFLHHSSGGVEPIRTAYYLETNVR